MLEPRSWGILLASTLVACNALLGTEAAETKPSNDIAESGDPPPTDEPGLENPRSQDDAGTSDTPATCDPSPSDCLDPSRDDVIEVPTERTMGQALVEVKANQTIQLRKGTTSGVLKLPPYVTLRGCEGAKLREDSTIMFAGSAGAVEGLEVYGHIIANQTGRYVVRGVKCLARESETAAPNVCIEGRAIDGLVGASVDLTVEQSLFENREGGVQAATSYDTLTREVKLAVRNNVFRKVTSPVVVSEAGLVGKISVAIAFNTFVDFGSAIALFSASTPPLLRGNLFDKGERVVETDSPYTVEYSAAFSVAKASTRTPLTGSLIEIDPKLDENAIPSSTSLVVDAVTTSSDADPCPRPRVGRSGEALADIGALER